MNPYPITLPESAVVFEYLRLAILKRHWSRPGLKRFGKKNEEQFGVDIFDTMGESPMYGAYGNLAQPGPLLISTAYAYLVDPNATAPRTE